MRILSKGAEAIIIYKGKTIIKKRLKKGYRNPTIDEKIRKQRTRSEAKLIEKSEKIIPTPHLIGVNEKSAELEIEFIKGKKLSENLERLNIKQASRNIGENISKLHNAGIIHGDLTTSNMIFKDKKVYFIDFGLGFHSNRNEDKAVDLHLIKEALEAKHPKIYERSFKVIIDEYKRRSLNSKAILAQLQKVEKRGRYKAQY